MFTIESQLLEAQDVRLGPIDHETHPLIESKWTHDAEFMCQMELRPTHPLTPAMVREQYETVEKDVTELQNLSYFTIRVRDDDRFIGKALIEWVDRSAGNGYLRLGIGEPGFRRKGYGSQALSLLLSHAFDELDLYRVTAVVPAYNQGALRLFQKFGFMEEVRRRRVLYCAGELWDVIAFGLLNAEWRESKLAQE